MYRKSSKGNPYHDSNGRFTSKNGTGGQSPVMWSSFGEQAEIDKDMKLEDKEKLDHSLTQEHMTDGKRFYHNKSISREQVARSLSSFTIPKGTPRKERKQILKDSKKAFEKENAVAIKNGGKVRVICKGNSMSYQIVESKRMANETSKGGSSVTRNTATSMKLFHGYTVEFTANNEVRSCKKNATLKESAEHFDKYTMKHKKVLSDKNVCMKVWRNKKDNRVFYMPTYFFETKEEADAFAAKHKNAKIVNHDDGSQA